MALPLEDYAFIGDLHTGALVGRDGSIDWLCLPHFDSDACFAALLGTAEHGRFRIAPVANATATRRYRGHSLVLETEFRTAEGTVRVVDCMPVRDQAADLVRRVQGVRGRVRMRAELRLRFDFGSVVPWIRRLDGRVQAIAGPDTVIVDAGVPMHDEDGTLYAEFTVAPGEAVDFRFGWTAPRQPLPLVRDVGQVIDTTEKFWLDWSDRCGYSGPYHDLVMRSLITLKAMTYQPSGGIVAALTTSLPEQLGGVRNWDYRYCWIRDATYTLLVLLDAGYVQEARAWREWLLRALAGRPEQMQIMYGINGKRRLSEVELPWLPGYAGSRPVRIGNAASGQFQLDVYGELMDALHHARLAGLEGDVDAWRVQTTLMDFLESHWQDPDEGIWEARGPRRDFTHSKVMAWVAVDRAIANVEQFGLPGPVDKWRRLRGEIFDEVCAKGYDGRRGSFTRYYGSSSLDAALLLIPMVGFLPVDDERVTGTVAAIERELCQDGFVQRYTHGSDTEQVDGLPSGEGAFLACSFWLVDNYLLQGRRAEAVKLFGKLVGLANDVGLLAEEYDVSAGRMVGNFPQALSHIQLVSTAQELERLDSARRGGRLSPRRRRTRGRH